VLPRKPLFGQVSASAEEYNAGTIQVSIGTGNADSAGSHTARSPRTPLPPRGSDQAARSVGLVSLHRVRRFTALAKIPPIFGIDLPEQYVSARVEADFDIVKFFHVTQAEVFYTQIDDG
jgi:hypothetical protein